MHKSWPNLNTYYARANDWIDEIEASSSNGAGVVLAWLSQLEHISLCGTVSIILGLVLKEDGQRYDKINVVALHLPPISLSLSLNKHTYTQSHIPSPSHSPANTTRKSSFLQQKVGRSGRFYDVMMMSGGYGLDFLNMKCLLPMCAEAWASISEEVLVYLT